MAAKTFSASGAIAIALCARAAAGAAGLAVADVNIVDLSRGEIVAHSTVLTNGSKITFVGPVTKAHPGSNLKRVHAAGNYIIPGLWEAHAHLSYAGACALPVMLAYGITGVRDLGGDLKAVMSWRAQIAAHRMVGPTVIQTAGPNIESAEWLEAARRVVSTLGPEFRDYFTYSPRIRVGSPAEARSAVEELIQLKVDFIKFRDLGGEEVRALIEYAHSRGLKVAGHAAEGLTLAQAAEAGQDSIEHAETVEERLSGMSVEDKRREFRRIAAAGSMITPTLIMSWKSKGSTDSELHDAVFNSEAHPYVSTFLRKQWRLGYETRNLDEPRDWSAFLHAAAEDMGLAREEGVRFMAGTDLGVILVDPGSSLHEEMEMMVNLLHMTPLEVLRSATENTVRWLRLEHSRGTIREGMAADLVVLSDNPLVKISNTTRIVGVVAGGRWFDRRALDSLLRETRKVISAGQSCVTGE